MKDYLQRKKKTKLAAEMFNSNTGNNKIVESLQIWGEMSPYLGAQLCFQQNCFSRTMKKRLFIQKQSFMKKNS